LFILEEVVVVGEQDKITQACIVIAIAIARLLVLVISILYCFKRKDNIESDPTRPNRPTRLDNKLIQKLPLKTQRNKTNK
jgi:hypothetical protein